MDQILRSAIHIFAILVFKYRSDKKTKYALKK